MSDPHPRVSIGMPVYNGAAHLADALDSVLAQSFVDYELIICDNASTDGTEAICRAYAERDERIRYVRSEANLGAARNFNRTFELSAGEYFKWFAHDDILDPRYLQCCVEVLDASPGTVVLCFPQRLEMTHDGRVLGPDRKRRWFEASPPYDHLSFARLLLVPERRFPTLVFGLMRADALRKTRMMGAYNCADLVLVTELRLLGGFRQIDEPLFLNRLHEETPMFKAERRTFTGEAAWYDPTKTRRLLLPEVKLLIERLRAVRRAPLGAAAKMWCIGCVLVGQLVARVPPWLNKRGRVAIDRSCRWWERVSLAAVRRSRRHYLPHRAWVFLSGLRRFEMGLLLLALSPPTSRTRAALLRFVAERFRRRHERESDKLLAEWLAGTCAARRVAAADAIARDGERFRKTRPERLPGVVRPQDSLKPTPTGTAAEGR